MQTGYVFKGEHFLEEQTSYFLFVWGSTYQAVLWSIVLECILKSIHWRYSGDICGAMD